jgi:hypothetical protein
MNKWLRKIYVTGFLLAVLGSGPLAAAPTGTVTINGRVPAVCDVVVTPEAGSQNIPDISLGDTDRIVATVNENCNNVGGYTMTLVGTNSGDHTGLFIDSVSSDTHPFTVTYDSIAAPAGGVVTNVNAPGINLDKTVRISYPADANLTPSAGFTYAETLIFTIAAK